MSQDQITEKKPRHFLLGILFGLAVAMATFFVEQRAFFNPDSTHILSSAEYWLMFAISLSLLLGFWIAARRFYRLQINWVILGIVVLLFVGDVIAVMFFPGVYDTEQLVYSPSNIEKIRYVCAFLITCLGLYLTFAVAPQVLGDLTLVNFFFVALVFQAFIALAYSLVKETEIYHSIIANGGPQNAYDTPMSFTGNRNSYARICFYGIIAECYLHGKNPHWWRYLIMLLLFGAEFCTLSKTTLFVTVCFLGAFLILRFVQTYSRHKVRNWVLFGLFAFLVLSLIIGQSFGLFARFVPKLGSLLSKVKDVLLGSMWSSFSTRLYDWSDTLRTMESNPRFLIFGFGDYSIISSYQAIETMPFAFSVFPFDGAYLLILAKNGILGALLSLVFVVYLFVLLIKMIARKEKGAWTLALMLVAFLGMGFFENQYFLGFHSLCTVMNMGIALPVFISNFLAKHPENERQKSLQIANGYSQFAPHSVSLSGPVRLALFFMLPLMLFGITVAYSFNRVFAFVQLPYGSVFVLASWALFYFLVPLFISGLKTLKDQNKLGWAWLWGIFLVVWAVALVVLPWKSHGNYLTAGVSGLALVVFVFFLCMHLFPTISRVLQDYWRYFLFFITDLAVVYCVVHFGGAFTKNEFLFLALMPFVWWLFFFVALPHGVSTDPLEEKWTLLEERISWKCMRYQFKIESRQLARKSERNSKDGSRD